MPWGLPEPLFTGTTPPEVSARGASTALSPTELDSVGKRGSGRSVSQPTFHRQGSSRHLGRIARRRALCVLDSNHVPHSGATPGSARAAPPTPASPLPETGAFGHRSQSVLVVGYQQAQGAGQVELLLPVRGAGHLQPLRGGLDGGHPGECFFGQDAHLGKLHQATDRLGSVDSSRRPRAVHEVQVAGFAFSRLGGGEVSLRPHVRDDNPYSESQFKTLKYRPEFPSRFGSIQDARVFCQEFFRWYNTEHRHSGIGLHTPQDVHYQRAESRRQVRALALEAAFARSPERFPNGKPAPPLLPEAVWINRPKQEDSELKLH